MAGLREPLTAAPASPAVIVHAPGRDGVLTCQILERAGHACRACASDDDLLAALDDLPAAVLLAEEVLTQSLATRLRASLDAQEPWSDLPVLVVARPGAHDVRLGMLSALGNVSILVRPMAIDALASAVAVALRARARQFEVRDLLERSRADARRKDEFLAMLAHELRNPLAPIRYAARGLTVLPPDRLANLAAVIERQCAHMGRIIDRLLDASRITRGLLTLERSPLDFSILAADAARVAGPLAASREVTFDSRIEGGLWVDGDATRLRQILDNLIDNAVRFTPRGGHIRVVVRRIGDQVQADVCDDGDGIAPDVIGHVFDAFTQADVSLERRRGGLGLGLALARGLAQLHGGTIAAASEGLGHGSTFTVMLPCADGPAHEPARAPLEGAGAALRVLVVEDNVDAAVSLGGLLEAAGHTVRIVHDGRDAVATTMTWNPDAMVCDIGLPGLNGYEVARTARARAGRHVRLLAVTGYGRPEDVDAARAAGFDAHFAKPVDPTELLLALQGCEGTH